MNIIIKNKYYLYDKTEHGDIYLGKIFFDRATKKWVYDDENKDYIYFTLDILENLIKEFRKIREVND